MNFVFALFCFRRRRGFKVYRRQLRNNLLKWVIIQNITTWDFIVACSIGKLDSLGYINLLWVTQEKKTKTVHVFWTMVFYRTLLPLGNLKFLSKVLLISNGIGRGLRTFEAGTNLSYCSELHCETKKLDFTEPL